MTESTMRSNQPSPALLAQVPLPGKTKARNVMFTLGNTRNVEKLATGQSHDAYDDALRVAQLDDGQDSGRFLNPGFQV